MDERARVAYLELLKLTLTRTFELGEGRQRGRRRPVVGLIMSLLAAREFIVVPRLPSTEGRSVRHVPGLPGSVLLAAVLWRRGFAIVADGGCSETFGRGRTPARSGHLSLGWIGRVRATEREFGLDWPEHAETMAGLRRLNNVQECMEDVIARGVPGDFIETGVWRGGTSIFMRAVLAARGETSASVWVADSFAGLPRPNAIDYPADEGLDYFSHGELSVGLNSVRANFARYGMLDDRVRFLPGWFKDTLPDADIDRLALLRLDGDLYESTIDALRALYPKLSVGGYCIVDDYGALDACRRAVDDYRATHGITEPMEAIDWTGTYWRRERE